jgi:plasmid maintenance system killer protein
LCDGVWGEVGLPRGDDNDRSECGAVAGRIDVAAPPGFRIHQLSGSRAGTWSISLTGNWRVTFDIEYEQICNLNLEDYH